ncbi:MAG: CRISPR-associated endonuclease Cas3'' [Byssovorax sp.]
MGNDTARIASEALAHLTPDGREHGLLDHLRAVAEAASRFAAPFGGHEIARLTGLWHDLGKYAGGFQKMIREANGFEAHIEGDAGGPRDHSSAGAIHASRTLGPAGKVMAFAIAGHHAGLANHADLRARLDRKESYPDRCLERAKEGGASAALLTAVAPPLPAYLFGATLDHARRLEMWTRMLFSALCDADFLDTEAFYREDLAALRGGGPAIADLSSHLTQRLDELEAGAPSTEVNRVRAEVRRACAASAHDPPGIFSLTVPTGGGKTLASLAFALAHAEHHGLSRVVVAIPFTSIIEQSAKAYRDALPIAGAVLEHHSALDPNRDTPQNRIASENWDSPVIVTTTVQLLESLFANRPGACRKLHRLARSVIVLDEAQSLPAGMLAPILDGLRTLVRDFGASIVICTATQPAFGRTPWLEEGFEGVREIVPAEVRAFDRLRRVRARWPSSLDAVSYEDLAEEIARERDVLAIVHLRNDARELTAALDRRLGDDTTLHLSALMCAEHRSRVLATIKERKQRGEPVRLVATQLVEAGVDLDFAVVYRALGGLDALAQAAGRCNREGRLDGLGELRVFVAPTKPPRGVPEAALAVTLGMLAGSSDLDLFAPASFTAYFQRLFATRSLDEKRIQEARAALKFKDVADLFKLIDDEWSAPIVVPCGDDAAEKIDAIERLGPSRDRLRAVQRLTVNVKRTDRERWIQSGYARWIRETVVVLDVAFATAYQERFGLIPDRVGHGSFVL